MTTVPNSTDLRMLAEAVDGIRNENACLIEENARLVVVPESKLAGREPIYSFRTEPKKASAKQFDHIHVGSGGVDTDIQQTHDALFWSEAAVAKFVLPYYQRLIAPGSIEWLWQIFLQEDVVAIAHLPLSDPDFLGVYSDIGSPGKPQLFTLGRYLQIVARRAAPEKADPAPDKT